MLKRIIIIFLLGLGILYAQNSVMNTDPLVNDQEYNFRLNLAYQKMLQNLPDAAVQDYESCLQIDSLRIEAWLGIMWAKNTQLNWEGSIEYGQRALKIFKTNNSALCLMLAYAYSSENKLYQARYYYSKASLTEEQKKDAALGLFNIYMLLNNSVAAQKSVKNLDVLTKAEFKIPGPKWESYTEAGLLLCQAPEKSYIFSHESSWKSVGINFNTDAFLNKYDAYRYAYTGGLTWKTALTSYRLNGHYIKGDYYKIYPMKGVSVQATHKFYHKWGETSLNPMIAYSYYPVVSAYEAGLKLKTEIPKFSFTLSGYVVNQDYANLKADKVAFVGKYEITWKASRYINITPFAETGDQSFFVSPDGYIVDNYSSFLTAGGLNLTLMYKTNYLITSFKTGRQESKLKNNIYIGYGKAF